MHNKDNKLIPQKRSAWTKVGRHRRAFIKAGGGIFLTGTGAGKVLCGPGGEETTLLLRPLISAVQNWKAGLLDLGASWR